jgi:PAS domain S-box-containing protein
MHNAATTCRTTKAYEHLPAFNDDVMEKYSLRQHDMSVTIDIAGRIVDCSAQARALLGKSADELSGMVLSDVIPQLPFGSNTPYYNYAYAVFHSGDDKSMQRTALLANGKKMPLNISLSPTLVKRRRLIKLKLAPSEFVALKDPLT